MSIPEQRDPTIENQISRKAAFALVWGIVGLILSGACCGFLSIYAIILAAQGDSMIKLYGYGEEHRSMLMAGRILGWMGVVIWIASIPIAFILSLATIN